MAKKEIPCTSSCVAFATKVLGDKWNPRLIFVLSEKSSGFNNLQEEAGGVNPRTLSKRLCDLEKIGIIKKTIYSKMPPKTEYSLTKKGADLVPILKKMAIWGEKYF